MNPLVLVLFTVVAALWRIGAAYEPGWSNFAPIAALAFCGAAGWRERRWALVPLGALTATDLWLNHYHAAAFGYTWSAGEQLARLAAYGGAIALGRAVSRRATPSRWLLGTFGASMIFYLATNSVAWLSDPFYAKTSAGWWQAMTVGRPEFPPTLWFFRNTLIGDLTCGALFAAAFAWRPASAGARARATPGA